MVQNKPKILIIGSIPPPFIGPSVAMQKLINAKTIQESFNLLFLDISDRREPKNIGKFDITNSFLAFIHIAKFLYFLFFKRPCLVYISISQGLWGYIRDLGFFVPSVIFRKRIIIHLRGSEFDVFYRQMPTILNKITQILFKRVTNIIVLGETLRHVFKDLVKDEKIIIIPNGIDYKIFDQEDMPPSKENNSGKRILYLSGLLKRKGILRLIEALPLVFQRHPDANITIAGEWQNKKEKDKAFNLIAFSKINGQINFTGEVSGANKIKLYKDNDIFVFPPIEPEGLPWVILEAMSARLPIISTNQGTISEVIEDGKTGFIIDPTPENIAEKICYLIENPLLAKKMGERGRYRVENFFPESTYLEKIKDVFHKATN